jgi:hypothetical protein
LPAAVRTADQAGTKGLERTETMSVLDWLRKGFGFLLMSFGVSSPAKKPRPSANPADKPRARK